MGRFWGIIFGWISQHDFGGGSEAYFLGEFHSIILMEDLRHNFRGISQHDFGGGSEVWFLGFSSLNFDQGFEESVFVWNFGDFQNFWKEFVEYFLGFLQDNFQHELEVVCLHFQVYKEYTPLQIEEELQSFSCEVSMAILFGKEKSVFWSFCRFKRGSTRNFETTVTSCGKDFDLFSRKDWHF